MHAKAKIGDLIMLSLGAQDVSNVVLDISERLAEALRLG